MTNLYGQNVIEPSNSNFTKPGVYGKIYVFSGDKKDGIYKEGLLVVTDKNLTRIFGESTFFNLDKEFRISNLPQNQELLLILVYQNWLTHIEKLSISGWQNKNIYIDVKSFESNTLDKQLGQSILGILSLAGHYSEIILNGIKSNSSEALIRTIHYLRIIGKWDLLSMIDEGKKSASTSAFSYIFNKDGTGYLINNSSKENIFWNFRIVKNNILFSINNIESIFKIKYDFTNNYSAELFYDKDNTDRLIFRKGNAISTSKSVSAITSKIGGVWKRFNNSDCFCNCIEINLEQESDFCVEPNQINIKVNYKLNNELTKIEMFLVEPTDLGRGGAFLPWELFSKKVPIALIDIKELNNNKITVDWIGFRTSGTREEYSNYGKEYNGIYQKY